MKEGEGKGKEGKEGSRERGREGGREGNKGKREGEKQGGAEGGRKEGREEKNSLRVQRWKKCVCMFVLGTYQEPYSEVNM